MLTVVDNDAQTRRIKERGKKKEEEEEERQNKQVGLQLRTMRDSFPQLLLVALFHVHTLMRTIATAHL